MENEIMRTLVEGGDGDLTNFLFEYYCQFSTYLAGWLVEGGGIWLDDW